MRSTKRSVDTVVKLRDASSSRSFFMRSPRNWVHADLSVAGSEDGHPYLFRPSARLTKAQMINNTCASVLWGDVRKGHSLGHIMLVPPSMLACLLPHCYQGRTTRGHLRLLQLRAQSKQHQTRLFRTPMRRSMSSRALAPNSRALFASRQPASLVLHLYLSGTMAIRL